MTSITEKLIAKYVEVVNNFQNQIISLDVTLNHMQEQKVEMEKRIADLEAEIQNLKIEAASEAASAVSKKNKK